MNRRAAKKTVTFLAACRNSSQEVILAMSHDEESTPDTEELLGKMSAGDDWARQQLLARHRGRLTQMIAVRLDPRLAARVDPSDVVQEALADAATELDLYALERPLPFYPWLRRFAWERLVDLHRYHLRSQRRSAAREEQAILPLSDQSSMALAERLVAGGTSPSSRLGRAELYDQLRSALRQLRDRDREILVMRYLEQLSSAEIAAILGIQEGAVKMRLLRAMERLRKVFDAKEEGSP